MLIKKIPKAGHFAWSNSKKNNYLFATGTLRSPQDSLLNLDQENFLQIFSLDTGDKSEHLNCMGRTKCESPFSCLAWDVFDEENSYPYGIIVGGLQDGSLTIWDPNDIITYWKKHNAQGQIETNVGCICYEQNLFQTPVQAIEFNPFKSNLIATGGGSEVLIMNIERNISSPEIFSPGTPNLHQGSTISSVSWNKKVQHILASASLNGLTVVWDLKTNKPIFNFQDSSITYNRNISLAWNPEIPTQIAVSYDDEKNCELQIWDLRNPQGPVMLFGQGHTKGINCVNWCTNDPSLILTGGRDDKIVCWNYKTGELVSEMITGENVSNVRWSPKLPSIYSTTSENGNVTINTLSSEEITTYAPKWYKTPVFARFGRNNRLAVLMEDKPTEMQQFQLQKTNDKTFQELTQFEKIYSETEKTNDHAKFCDLKLAENLSPQSKLHWTFIKALLNSDKANYAGNVIEALGLSKNEIIKQAENYTGKTHRKKDEGSPKQQNANSTKAPRNNNYDFTLMSNKDTEAFFDQLSQVSTQKMDQKAAPKSSEIRKDSNLEQEIMALETISKNVNWDAGIEKIIKQNILIGNYEGAVDCALKCGRNGEALLLAYSHSPELFEATANAFFVASKDTFIKNVFKNIVEKQNKEIAKGYSLESWREVAALAISKKPDEFQEIMNIIGTRLLEEKNNQDEAILCFLLSRNIERLIEIFKKKIDTLPQNSSARRSAVINYTEKFVVLLQVLNVVIRSNPDFDRIIEEFVLLAVEYDMHFLAYKVLLFAGDKSFRVMELRDLLYHSSEEVASHFKPPPFPFKVEVVTAKIQNKVDQKKRANETKPIFNNPPQQGKQEQQTQPPQDNSRKAGPGGPANRPDMFVPARNVAPVKADIGPPKGFIGMPPVNQNQGRVYQNPVNPPNNPPPVITPPPVNTHKTIPPPGPFVPQKQPVENNVNNGLAPPQEKKQVVPGFHPPNVNPPLPRSHPEMGKVNTVPQPPPKKQIELAPEINQQQQVSSFQPVLQTFEKAAPVQPVGPPKNVLAAKNPPPRPGQTVNYMPAKPLQEEQKQPVEPQRQVMPEPKAKEVEVIPRKIDYGNMTASSQSMVDSINKAKNVLGVVEPNMRKKMEHEKTLDQLKDMIASEALKPETHSQLSSLLQCWENGNSNEALALHSKISSNDWDQNKDWLKTLKRVLLRK